MSEGPGRKRGRPRRVVGAEIVRELTAGDVALLEAMQDRGGRPLKNVALDKELLKAAADQCGVPLRDFIRAWVMRRFGRVADLKEVRSWERRIYRLRAAKRKPAALRQNLFVN